MDLNSHPMQILLVIAKGCKPNSPFPDREYMNLKPYDGLPVPSLNSARAALAKAGLVIEKPYSAWKVKPSKLGYVLVERWKEARNARRARPVLFAPVTKEFRGLDQRFDRWAA